MIQEIEFAPDSPLEEGGFEPLVPLGMLLHDLIALFDTLAT